MSQLVNYPLPQWLAIAFAFAISAPFIIIARFVGREAKKILNKTAHTTTILFFVLYLLYIAFASYCGWFKQVMLPPKVLLLTTFPFALLLFVVVANTNVYKAIWHNAALHSMVKLHVFRLVGVFFILLAMYHALPKPFALIAGIGDVLTAITSIFVAKALQNKKSYAQKLTYYWCVFGTADILFTAIAANVLTKLSIDGGTMGVDALAMFPYCIIPAFAPPAILFLHWSIFKKLKTFQA